MEPRKLGQLDLEAAFEEIFSIIQDEWDEQGVNPTEREKQRRAFEAKLERLYLASRGH